jgi:hypothetical protein
VVITTIERRFGLQSTQTGLIAASYDIGKIIYNYCKYDRISGLDCLELREFKDDISSYAAYSRAPIPAVAAPSSVGMKAIKKMNSKILPCETLLSS